MISVFSMLADKDVNVVSFALSLAVLQYETLILRNETEAAAEVLQDVPEDQMNKIARFLEGQGYKEQALEVATDPEVSTYRLINSIVYQPGSY